MKIQDSVAIVTGGNRGIGEEFVIALVAAGAARVYVGARNPDSARHLAEQFGERVFPVRLDVTDEALVGEVARRCSDTTIVVNNAGEFLHKTLIQADSLDAARREMEVNYFGVLSMCREFAPVLKSNGGGAIVNVLSVGAIVAAPNMGGYSPSKSAARALTTNVRAELASQGIQVSGLIVGSVDTRMATHVQGSKEPPTKIATAGLKAIERNIPEIDTDAMAISTRAALARDPARLEREMASLLDAKVISTGK